MKTILRVLEIGCEPIPESDACDVYSVLIDHQWHLCAVAGDRLWHHIVEPESIQDLEDLVRLSGARQFISPN